MIIDFHTHVFPDKIVGKTIAMLSQKANVPAYSDGTADGLIARMEEAGVDVSVTLPVVTNPQQFDSILRFASAINERFANEKRRLISFAGIHPACEDIEGKMALIKKSGFLGVKLHPDYQGTFIDDEGYVKILECARENDLIVVTHAGYDFGFPDQPIRCTADRALNLIRRVPYNKLVLAHLGAGDNYADSLEKLCGLDVYLDTSFVLPLIDRDTFAKMLEKHGADRLLFATDSPWSSIKESVDIIKSFSLGSEAEEKIFSGNAKALLGL